MFLAYIMAKNLAVSTKARTLNDWMFLGVPILTAKMAGGAVARCLVMKLFLASCLLLTIAATSSVRGIRFELPSPSALMQVGLDSEPALLDGDACSNLALSRGLKYTDNEQNVLNVATSDATPSVPLPVLLFVAGRSFENDDTPADWEMRKTAICLSARNGFVGVSMSYRRAPAHDWPAGAEDVAAATSWVHKNIDLFGGDRNAIVVIGYSVGAFHLATFLAHRELQVAGADIAGAVLLSGIYGPGPAVDKGERAYLGTDPSQYNARSAFPGILKVQEPIVLSWSAVDPPALVAQAENLKERLCGAGHCPRTALLAGRDSFPASVFGLKHGDERLAEQVRLLIAQIEARGLP